MTDMPLPAKFEDFTAADVRELARRYNALLAASPPPAAWQPISTAPSNTAIIVCVGVRVGEACLLDYPDLKGWYFADDRDPMVIGPTHWMPLPTPPEPSAGA